MLIPLVLALACLPSVSGNKPSPTDVVAFAVAPRGMLAAVLGYDGQLRIVDLETSTCKKLIPMSSQMM